MDCMGYKRRVATRIDIEKAIVLFYNRIAQVHVSCISEIPREPLALLLEMNYEQVAAGLVRQDSKKGLNCEQLQIKWGMSERIIRRITGRK